MEIVSNTPTEPSPESTTLDAVEAEIRLAFAEANALALTAKGNARAAVLRMADVGQYLLIGREMVSGAKGEWIVGLGLSLDSASKAITLHRNRDQLELALWPADVAKTGAQLIGLLPPPGSANRDTNDPERSTGSSTLWVSHAGKLQKSLFELFNSRPLDQWRDDEREHVRVALQPLVDVYLQATGQKLA